MFPTLPPRLRHRALNQSDARGLDCPQNTRCVLVVDDHVDSALSLCTLLQMDGINAVPAHDGRSALATARRLRPRVVLLDLGLPDMAGEDVARQLRTESHGTELLLVALTGWGDEGDRQRTRSSGFDGHLLKPADPDAVLALIRPALVAQTADGEPPPSAAPA